MARSAERSGVTGGFSDDIGGPGGGQGSLNSMLFAFWARLTTPPQDITSNDPNLNSLYSFVEVQDDGSGTNWVSVPGVMFGAYLAQSLDKSRNISVPLPPSNLSGGDGLDAGSINGPVFYSITALYTDINTGTTDLQSSVSTELPVGGSGSGSVELSWNKPDAADGYILTGYQIWRGLNSNNEDHLVTTINDPTVLSYTDTGGYKDIGGPQFGGNAGPVVLMSPYSGWSYFKFIPPSNTSDLYVAKTPIDGLRAPDTVVGTGSAATENVYTGDCFIYYVSPEQSGDPPSPGELIHIPGLKKKVYSLRPVAGDTWIIIGKDKLGKWWVLDARELIWVTATSNKPVLINLEQGGTLKVFPATGEDFSGSGFSSERVGWIYEVNKGVPCPGCRYDCRLLGLDICGNPVWGMEWLEGTTTANPSLTTTANPSGTTTFHPCSGQCVYTWNAASSEWVLTSNLCAKSTTTTTTTSTTTTTTTAGPTTTPAPGGCNPTFTTTSTTTTTTTVNPSTTVNPTDCQCGYPTYCGVSNGECTTAQCISPDSTTINPCTTSSTSTTGGPTTTHAPCTTPGTGPGECISHDPCTTCIRFSASNCTPPECICTAHQPACSGIVLWTCIAHWDDQGNFVNTSWSGFPTCTCFDCGPPSCVCGPCTADPPSSGDCVCGSVTQSSCYFHCPGGTTTLNPCATTFAPTTTTPNPCGNCQWVCDGAGNWSRSVDCAIGCGYCCQPPYACTEACQTAQTPCSNSPICPTTSTTTTTTEGPTTTTTAGPTTTTTTCNPFVGTYCCGSTNCQQDGGCSSGCDGVVDEPCGTCFYDCTPSGCTYSHDTCGGGCWCPDASNIYIRFQDGTETPYCQAETGCCKNALTTTTTTSNPATTTPSGGTTTASATTTGSATTTTAAPCTGNCNWQCVFNGSIYFWQASGNDCSAGCSGGSGCSAPASGCTGSGDVGKTTSNPCAS